MLSDAVDRASAAQSEVTGQFPKALSGLTSDFNRDHPVPGSEEALIASRDAGALTREADKAAENAAQREAALEDFLQRPRADYNYNV